MKGKGRENQEIWKQCRRKHYNTTHWVFSCQGGGQSLCQCILANRICLPPGSNVRLLIPEYWNLYPDPMYTFYGQWELSLKFICIPYLIPDFFFSISKNGFMKQMAHKSIGLKWVSLCIKPCKGKQNTHQSIHESWEIAKLIQKIKAGSTSPQNQLHENAHNSTF